MQFRILGPLEVVHGDVLLRLGGVRHRAVLAQLLLEPGRSVSAERLIDDVWAAEPPATARKTLQKYVSELRRVLPEPVLRTTASGYLLDIAAEDVDANRFAWLVERSEFTAALALWRGDVLADLPGFTFAANERARLDELRLLAFQGRIEDELEAGRHEEAVTVLAGLLESHPHRERLVGLQMLALYRSGRQADALVAYELCRRRLDEDLGIEPGAELRDLHVKILRHDIGLDPLPANKRTRRSQGSLPPALTSFVGRRREIARLAETLTANRLVTVTGPGGVGKTRLALEAARVLADGFGAGAWLVDLAEVTAGDQVVVALAIALQIDVRHAPDELTAVQARLGHGEACLLVLDNCEHVVDACSELVRVLLRTCPAVTVLATSRRPLGVEGEYVLPLSSLLDEDAVRLFLERARLTENVPDGGFSTELLTDVCRQLDGLPLAIELAASQLRVVSLAELAARTSDRLAFRAAAAQPSPRQGTLRDMVSWSHELLPDGTRQVFARLAVFRGSLTLAGAEAVCTDLGLRRSEVLAEVTTLVDHSMLLRLGLEAPDTRYRLLESLRLFALERLAGSGALDSARRAHASFFRTLAAQAGQQIYGPDELAWQRRLELEAPNLDVALGWAADRDWSLAVDLAVALWPFWDAGWGERGAIAYVERLLAFEDPARDRRKRAWALVVAADLAANQGDARKAVPWAKEAVGAFDPEEDARGRACAMVALGSALGGEGALREAADVVAAAVAAAQALGDPVLEARALNRQHFVASRHGDQVLAQELGRRELARWRDVGSARGEATALRHLAVTAFRFGDLEHASDLCQQAMSIWREVDDPAAIAHVQTTLGDIARERGDTARASALYRAALVDLEAIGDRRCEASTCKNLAVILAVDGAFEQSVRLYREGISLRHELGDQAGLAECLEGLAASLDALTRHDESVVLLGAAAALRARTDSLLSAAEQEFVAKLEKTGRAGLGPARFAEAWQRGQRMGLSQVVGLAMATGTDALPDPTLRPLR